MKLPLIEHSINTAKLSPEKVGLTLRMKVREDKRCIHFEVIINKLILLSMLYQNIANRMRIVLARIDLFVHCPSQRLSKLGAYLTHSRHVLRSISRVICEHHTDKVFAGENFQVVKDFFDQLLLMFVVSLG